MSYNDPGMSPSIDAMDTLIASGPRVVSSAAPLDFPIDRDARLARFPPDATLKGMFFSRLLDLGGRHVEAERPRLTKPPRTGHYLPFGDYPQVDFARLSFAAATGLYPGVPLAEGQRRLARHDFATFAASAVGRVSLAMMGDAESALLRLPSAYAAVLRGGTLDARRVEPEVVEIVFRNFFGSVDCYPIGTVEGVAAYFGRSCDVVALISAPGDATYRVTLRRA